jgi:hypothetical protein
VAVVGALSMRSVTECRNNGSGFWCCWASGWPLAAGPRQIDFRMRIEEKGLMFLFFGVELAHSLQNYRRLKVN